MKVSTGGGAFCKDGDYMCSTQGECYTSIGVACILLLMYAFLSLATIRYFRKCVMMTGISMALIHVTYITTTLELLGGVICYDERVYLILGSYPGVLKDLVMLTLCCRMLQVLRKYSVTYPFLIPRLLFILGFLAVAHFAASSGIFVYFAYHLTLTLSLSIYFPIINTVCLATFLSVYIFFARAMSVQFSLGGVRPLVKTAFGLIMLLYVLRIAYNSLYLSGIVIASYAYNMGLRLLLGIAPCLLFTLLYIGNVIKRQAGLNQTRDAHLLIESNNSAVFAPSALYNPY